MLFNSYEFIFLFLPATLGIYIGLRRASPQLALGWIITASIFFYAWWRPQNLAIILPAILVNYWIARWLLRFKGEPDRERISKWLLGLGITFNLCVLGYFKYITFLQTALNDIAATNLVLTQVILPLGLSFITFQKIAFLIDVYSGKIESFRFRDFCLFILFFPQLIAGPIVHYREMMPQFLNLTRRIDMDALSVGVTLFVIGLFKKVVIADGMALHSSPIYEMAAAGDSVSLLTAWTAALGFTLQIYFDFSGYSDMALGVARCFGVRLPLNFDSPLKATSIIDFWSRWHVKREAIR